MTSVISPRDHDSRRLRCAATGCQGREALRMALHFAAAALRPGASLVVYGPDWDYVRGGGAPAAEVCQR